MPNHINDKPNPCIDNYFSLKKDEIIQEMLLAKDILSLILPVKFLKKLFIT